jgi:Family of unknown function (DUF6636)
MRPLVLILVLALGAGSAAAARLPGVRTPTRNISCFYVPVRPTTHGNLLCDIKRSFYARRLQQHCISPPTGLDWHGFELSETRKGEILCAGGIMYDPRDTPTFVTLAYGRTWRHKGFTCVSRVTGLTCTNRAGHGLFLSRESYRLF